MEKVSDYAKNELNWLIFKHFTRFFLIGIALILTKETEIIPLDMLYGLFYGISTVLLLFWASERESITGENENDIMREDDIENSCMNCSYEGLKISEAWVEKRFSSVRLMKTDEEEAQLPEYSEYRIVLAMQRDNKIITHTTEADISFALTDGIMLNIETFDFPAFLPRASDTNHLLKQIFASATERYHKRKNLKENMDYTAKALARGIKRINKRIDNILIKNFPIVLKIFLSGEQFQIAGKMMGDINGKKIFLITKIKSKEQEIVLLPTKTLAEITNTLRTRLSR